MRCRFVARAFAVASVCSVIVGCSFPSDYFGNRAVEYNREAEDATLSAMLLNIIRASQRRPMQFTGLQSVTGSSSTSGTIGGADQKLHNTPFVIPQATGSTFISKALTASGNASASISGGPTFTVPVLDTQEFYQGILQPVPLNVIDFFLEEGFPPELLADLFILSIEVTRIDDQGDCEQFIFKNNVSSDLAFGQFQAMIDYLVASGFVAERVSKSTSYGPPVPVPRAADAARAVDAYAHAAQAGLDFKKDRKTGKYTLEKKSSELRTCFAYKGGAYPDWLKAKDTSIFCGNSAQKKPGALGGEKEPAPACVPKALRRSAQVKPAAKPAQQPEAGTPVKQAQQTGKPATLNNNSYGEQGQRNGNETRFSGITLAPQVLERIYELQQAEKARRIAKHEEPVPEDEMFPVKKFYKAQISMKFITRSTEGILYYLGEIVRRELNPEHGDRRTIKLKVRLNYGTYPMEDCDDQNQISNIVPLGHDRRNYHDSHISISCQPIFVVNEGPSPGDSVVTVMYNGAIYSIPHSLEAGGRSSQVTELVKQVLNLNTSAKELPSTTVISVVGAQ